MNKKFLVSVVIFFIGISALFSIPVSADQAVLVADTWWTANHREGKRLLLDSIHSFNREGFPLVWLIKAEGGGFVLVSGDDAAHPILGYDLSSTFEFPVQSPEVQAWIDLCLDELWEIRVNSLDNKASKPFWDELLSGNLPFREPDRDVSPLIATNWNQDFPYNVLCPADASGPGGHVWAGCGAVAMAQIMRYWSHPIQGTGSNSYYSGIYGVQSANFGQTTYNWDNMPNVCPEDNLDIPLLLYHCGVSVNMVYSPTGSSSSGTTIASALSQYFGFNQCSYSSKSNYSSSTWNSMLRTSINEGKPICYRGEGSSGGHLFNLDGYQNQDYFHFNWGWSGAYNGYFYLSNLNPGSYTFTNGQGAIIGAHPLQVYNTPQNAVASNLGYQISTSWNPPTGTGCTGYKLYANGDLVTTLAGVSNTSYTYEVLEYGDYLIQVAAIYSTGHSVQVNAGSVSIAPPSEPILWQESFDQPQGWTVGPYWSLNNGKYTLYSNPSPSNYDTSLDSPVITLPANAKYLVTSMYIRDVSANTGEVCEIAVVVNNQSTVLWTHNNNSDWGMFYGSPVQVPISQFAGQNVKIRYRSYGGLLGNLGYWHIYGTNIAGILPLDVSGGNIDTGNFGVVGSASQISVQVKNRGLNPASNLQVSLYLGGGGLLGTNLIGSLASGDSTQTQFSITPTQTGVMKLYALISLAGDMFAGNNYTEIGVLNVYPTGYFFRSLGSPAVKSGAPIYANGYTGFHQTLILQSELLCQGQITGFTLRSQFGVQLPDKPLKVWISNTSMTSITSLQSVAQQTLVYDDLLHLPIGEQLINITFDQPFVYNGQNILISYYTPSIQTYGGQTNFWAYLGDSSRNRGIYTTNNTQTYDPLSPPAGYSSTYVPCITLTINGSTLVNITGRVVTGTQNLGVPSATISLSGPQSMQTTSSSSGEFCFSGLLSNTNYQYTITAAGYQPFNGNFSTGVVNLNLGNISLQELIIAPQNVTSAVGTSNAYCIVSWTWSLARTEESNTEKLQNQRVQSGFTVYRLIPGQENQPGLWTLLSSVSAQLRSYLDTGWGSLMAGEYIYAVKTQYNYTQESNAAFSQTTVRYTDGRVLGTIVDQANQPISGATITLQGNGGFGPYTVTSDPSGNYILPQVHYGAYTLTGHHPYYYNNAASISVLANQDTQQALVLQDRILAPTNLVASIDAIAHTAELTWSLSEPPRIGSLAVGSLPNRALSGFSVWRASTIEINHPGAWTSLGSTTAFSWSDTTWYNLSNGDYIYIVKANYNNGAISSPCMSNPLPHIYYTKLQGSVVNNDDLILAGVSITLTSELNNYETSSDSLGCYSFDMVLPGQYQLSCFAVGYDPLHIPGLSLEMHQTTDYLVCLQEVLLAPDSLFVQIISGEPDSCDWVSLEWGLSDPPSPALILGRREGSRSLTGFSIWRALGFGVSDPPSWTFLGSTSSFSWADTTWYNSPNGDYCYIVKALYTNDLSSAPCISGSITHLYYARLNGSVFSNDGLAVTGAEILLSSTAGTYEAYSDSLGVFVIESVLPGQYQLSCIKAGYDPFHVQNLDLLMHQTNQCQIELQEMLITPESIEARVLPGAPGSQDIVEISWHHGNINEDRILHGFKIWRLQPGQIEQPELWLPLHEGVISDTLFIDSSWPPSAEGDYLYAVKACYSQEQSSEPGFSNTLEYVLVELDDETAPALVTSLSAYPNPFNPSLTVALQLSEAGPARVEIFNLKGQMIRTLLDTPLPAGSYNLPWDGRGEGGELLCSGLYFIRLTHYQSTSVYRVVLMK